MWLFQCVHSELPLHRTGLAGTGRVLRTSRTSCESHWVLRFRKDTLIYVFFTAARSSGCVLILPSLSRTKKKEQVQRGVCQQSHRSVQGDPHAQAHMQARPSAFQSGTGCRGRIHMLEVAIFVQALPFHHESR